MKNLLFISAVLLLFSSCAKYPADTITTEENDLIGTLYDNGTDFGSFSTFAIVDSVIYVKREAGEIEADTGIYRYSDRMINLVAENMTARGYTRVHKDSTPDLGIGMVIISDENIGSYTYWGGWGGYWGWYGWGYWYPWPTTTYYSYEQGTVIMNMADLVNRDDVNKELKVVWNNVALGLISNTTSSNTNRLDRAINIMFEQSPYIQR